MPDLSSAPEAEAVKLFLCGDVMTGRGVDQILPSPCPPRLYEQYVASALDYVRLAEQANGPIPRPAALSYVWGAALDELARAKPDARIINLETSITRSEAYAAKGINYRMSPENAGCLSAAAIDCCALANNHVLDWGRDGLVETLATLERLGIKTVGAGRNLAEARAPALLPVQGKGRILVLSFASTTSGVPLDWAATRDTAGVSLITDLSAATASRIAGEIAAQRMPRDVVVISIHWGPNWGYRIGEAQRRFAHALIDEANVSVVHGHSSHHPKAIEAYKSRLILYGCGDFLDDYEGITGYEAFRDDLVLMYFATIRPATGAVVDLEMVPLQIRRFRLSRPSSEDCLWLQTILDRECRAFGGRVSAKPDGRLALSWSE